MQPFVIRAAKVQFEPFLTDAAQSSNGRLLSQDQEDEQQACRQIGRSSSPTTLRVRTTHVQASTMN